MRDARLAGAVFAFGWLMSNTWTDPGCQAGLVTCLVVAVAMVLAFAIAVAGHGRGWDRPGDNGDDDESQRLRAAVRV